MKEYGWLTLSTTCVSSKAPTPTIRGPRDCAWMGISSCSPVYFGFGRALERDVAVDVMLNSANGSNRKTRLLEAPVQNYIRALPFQGSDNVTSN